MLSADTTAVPLRTTDKKGALEGGGGVPCVKNLSQAPGWDDNVTKRFPRSAPRTVWRGFCRRPPSHGPRELFVAQHRLRVLTALARVAGSTLPMLDQIKRRAQVSTIHHGCARFRPSTGRQRFMCHPDQSGPAQAPLLLAVLVFKFGINCQPDTAVGAQTFHLVHQQLVAAFPRLRRCTGKAVWLQVLDPFRNRIPVTRQRWRYMSGIINTPFPRSDIVGTGRLTGTVAGLDNQRCLDVMRVVKVNVPLPARQGDQRYAASASRSLAPSSIKNAHQEALEWACIESQRWTILPRRARGRQNNHRRVHNAVILCSRPLAQTAAMIAYVVAQALHNDALAVSSPTKPALPVEREETCSADAAAARRLPRSGPWNRARG